MDRWETHITAKSPTSMTEKDPRRTGTDSDARRISGCLATHPHYITFTKPSYKPWSTSLIISSNIHSTRFWGDLRVKRRRRRSSPTRTKCDIAYRWQNLMHYNAFSAMEASVVNCVEVRDRYEKLTIGANDLLTGWRKQSIFSSIRDCASRISLSNDLASAFVTTEWFLLQYCLIPTLKETKTYNSSHFTDGGQQHLECVVTGNQSLSRKSRGGVNRHIQEIRGYQAIGYSIVLNTQKFENTMTW